MDEVGVGTWTRGCGLARLVLRSKDRERKFVEILLDDDEVYEAWEGSGRRADWRWRKGGWKLLTRFGAWRGELDVARR